MPGSIIFHIVPVDLVSDHSEALSKAITSFNECQTEFAVQLVELNTFSDDEVVNWPNFRDWLLERYTDHRTIAVTSKPFADNWFGHTEGRITGISAAEWHERFRPPGLHCYFLLEFAMATYFHASDISESEASPHEITKGCLMDFCLKKLEMKWKLRVGYICSAHQSHFRRHGGTDSQLTAISDVLDEVRRVTLGRPEQQHTVKVDQASSAVAKSTQRHGTSVESLNDHALLEAAETGQPSPSVWKTMGGVIAALAAVFSVFGIGYQLGGKQPQSLETRSVGSSAVDSKGIEKFEVSFSIGGVEKEGATFSLRLKDAKGNSLDSQSAAFGSSVGEGGKTDAVYLGTSRLSLHECDGLSLVVKAKTPLDESKYQDHWRMEPIIVAISPNGDRSRVYVEPSGMIDFYTPKAAERDGLDIEATVEEWSLKCSPPEIQ